MPQRLFLRKAKKQMKINLKRSKDTKADTFESRKDTEKAIVREIKTQKQHFLQGWAFAHFENERSLFFLSEN